jgi:hypothetical protein
LEKRAAMCLPTELVKISSIGEGFPADFQWRIAIGRSMYTMTVLKFFKLFKLSVQVTGIPKEYVV